MNILDPTMLILLAFGIGIVLAGLYFAMREVIADAILLAEKKRKVQKQQERDKRS